MTVPSDHIDTVGRLLAGQATARGEHPLLVCDHERLSYRDAEERSADLARGLVALGAGKGTHVGVLHPNGAAFVLAALAAARIGAVVVPFSTFGTEPAVRYTFAVAAFLAAGVLAEMVGIEHIVGAFFAPEHCYSADDCSNMGTALPLLMFGAASATTGLGLGIGGLVAWRSSVARAR